MTTFLKARWENIIMVNYEVDENLLIPYLPYGVELDKFNNKSYISLVGFRFLDSKIFGIPIPFYGSFDEVNLRFYVKRKDGNEIKRGVVFISEIVPNKIVAFMANKLYKEHYEFAKMKHVFKIENNKKTLEHYWTKANEPFCIKANFNIENNIITDNSLEEFIYEHYYGFTKVNNDETWEYKVNHDRWKTNKTIDYKIECNFETQYGKAFQVLNNLTPVSIYNALGSDVTIDWKINKIKK